MRLDSASANFVAATWEMALAATETPAAPLVQRACAILSEAWPGLTNPRRSALAALSVSGGYGAFASDGAASPAGSRSGGGGYCGGGGEAQGPQSQPSVAAFFVREGAALSNLRWQSSPMPSQAHPTGSALLAAVVAGTPSACTSAAEAPARTPPPLRSATLSAAPGADEKDAGPNAVSAQAAAGPAGHIATPMSPQRARKRLHSCTGDTTTDTAGDTDSEGSAGDAPTPERPPHKAARRLSPTAQSPRSSGSDARTASSQYMRPATPSRGGSVGSGGGGGGGSGGGSASSPRRQHNGPITLVSGADGGAAALSRKAASLSGVLLSGVCAVVLTPLIYPALLKVLSLMSTHSLFSARPAQATGASRW